MKKIKLVSGIIAGFVAGVYLTYKKEHKKTVEEHEIMIKNDKIIKVLAAWLEKKQQGKSLSEYFECNGYKTVAIYGMGNIGKRVYKELSDSGIEVKYIIDKNADKTFTEYEEYTPDEELPEVDSVIITTVTEIDEIERKIADKLDCAILSIEGVVNAI